ncbi:MAG TPA: O-succinylhomoserine sulfhydrylase [Alphaproteobacteria bacterium]|nr:O-succinylhomoserine sulfhydrylase [Alphaproteobacteria bacterium]
MTRAIKRARADNSRAQDWRADTNLVRGGTGRSAHGETSEAIFLTSGFVYDNAEEAEARFKGEADGFIYSRYGNPTISMFEKRLALLEGAEACFATATGMAAVFASLLCHLRAGQRVVAARALFGSCHFIITQLLPRWGIETTLVDGTDLAQWKSALAPGAAAVFFETPSNPTLELIDIAAVSKLSHKAGATVIVDNVFSTPMLQRPLAHGADIVVYSATKHIDGQGRTLGGAVLSTKQFYSEHLMPFMRHTGPAMSPFNAWVMLKGLETLAVRVERHCANARAVADFLADHKGVARVYFPGHKSHPQYKLARRQMSGPGNMVSFEIKGGKAPTFRFLNALEIVDISNNLGDTKSLITHPATTTHRAVGPEARARMGIGDGLVRLSVGLENVNDLVADLDRALKAAR